MKPEQREFVDKMMTECQTHEQWLMIMNFGMPIFITDEDVLIEVIINEASKQVECTKGAGQPIVSEVIAILQELGLRFCCTEAD